MKKIASFINVFILVMTLILILKIEESSNYAISFYSLKGEEVVTNDNRILETYIICPRKNSFIEYGKGVYRLTLNYNQTLKWMNSKLLTEIRIENTKAFLYLIRFNLDSFKEGYYIDAKLKVIHDFDELEFNIGNIEFIDDTFIEEREFIIDSENNINIEYPSEEECLNIYVSNECRLFKRIDSNIVLELDTKQVLPIYVKIYNGEMFRIIKIIKNNYSNRLLDYIAYTCEGVYKTV